MPNKPETYLQRLRAKHGPGPTRSTRAYDRRWQRVRALKLSTHPLCEECDARGLIVTAVPVHHIVPIADGGEMYDLANLQSLCPGCHAKQPGHGV